MGGQLRIGSVYIVFFELFVMIGFFDFVFFDVKVKYLFKNLEFEKYMLELLQDLYRLLENIGLDIYFKI